MSYSDLVEINDHSDTENQVFIAQLTGGASVVLRDDAGGANGITRIESANPGDFAVHNLIAPSVMLTIGATDLADTIAVESINEQFAVALMLDAGEGDDIYTISADAGTVGIAFAVSDSGPGERDTLTITETPEVNEWSVDSGQVTTLSGVAVNYLGIEELTVDGAGGNDLFTVIASIDTRITIIGGLDDDTLLIDAQQNEIDSLGSNPLTIRIQGHLEIVVPNGMERIEVLDSPFEVQLGPFLAGLGTFADWAMNIAGFGAYAQALPLAGTPEVQTIVVPTSLSSAYTLSWQGESTNLIDPGATGAELQAALRALRGLDRVQVSTVSTPTENTHTITFRGVRFGADEFTAFIEGNPVPEIVIGTLSDGGRAYGDLLDAKAVLAHLQSQLTGAFPGATAMSGDVLNFLNTQFNGLITAPIASMLGDITVSIDGAMLVAGSVIHNGQALPFIQVPMSTTRTSRVWFSEADDLLSQKLFFSPQDPTNFDASMELTTGFVEFDLRFGAGTTFFVEPIAIDATAEAHETSRQGPLDVGIATVTAAAGSVDLTVERSVLSFADPAGDGSLLFESEFSAYTSANGNLGQLLSLDAIGNVQAQFPVAIDPAFDPIGGPLGYTITVGVPGENFFTTTSDHRITIPSGLRQFTTITASDILTPLLRLATWLDQLGETSIFDPSVWMVEDTTLRDLFTSAANQGSAQETLQGLGRALREELTNKLQRVVSFSLQNVVEERILSIEGSPTGGTFSLIYVGQSIEFDLFDINGEFILTAGHIEQRPRELTGLAEVTVRGVEGRSPNMSYAVRFAGHNDPGGSLISSFIASSAFTGGGSVAVTVPQRPDAVTEGHGRPLFRTVQGMVAIVDTLPFATLTPVFDRATQQMTLRVQIDVQNLLGSSSFLTPLTLNLEHVIGAVQGVVLDLSGPSPRLVVTSIGHGLKSGQRVTISGVIGIEAANGTFRIERIDADRFALVDADPTPVAVGDVLDASVLGSGVIELRVANHGLQTGELVRVSGIVGLNGANGDFDVLVRNQNVFELVGSTGTGSYQGGGEVEYLYVSGGEIRFNPLDPLVNLNNYFVGRVDDATPGPSGVEILLPGHDLQTGQRVTVTNIQGLIGANGTFEIEVINTDRFRLNTVAVTGTYVQGGIVSLAEGDLGSLSDLFNNVSITAGVKLDFTFGLDFTPIFLTDADRTRLLSPSYALLDQTGLFANTSDFWLEVDDGGIITTVLLTIQGDPNGQGLSALVARIQVQIDNSAAAGLVLVRLDDTNGYRLVFDALLGTTARVYVDDPNLDAARLLGLAEDEYLLQADTLVLDPNSFANGFMFDLIIGAPGASQPRQVTINVPA